MIYHMQSLLYDIREKSESWYNSLSLWSFLFFRQLRRRLLSNYSLARTQKSVASLLEVEETHYGKK